MNDLEPPGGLVDITVAGETLKLWPYTGTNFSGKPQDPLNLIFVGQADPVQIRATLLALDGDRTALGFPDAFPFNATWSDAIGEVQTAYAEGHGWVGSVVQLQLGAYSPMRFHLRLFRSESAFGSDGAWTMGNAHFDITIPGTPEHQVLCWEVAEKIVIADLVRSGLLANPPVSTGVINQAPSFRAIPVTIYNGMPEAVKAACSLPPGPATTPVPIPSDGEATVLHLAAGAPVKMEKHTETLTVQFDQFIPRPFCSEGPLDFIHVVGPLSLEKTVRLDGSDRYKYESTIFGDVIVTPVDIAQTPPVPVGDPFPVTISDKQTGSLGAEGAEVRFEIKRIARQAQGTESLKSTLTVSTGGHSSFRSQTQCLGPGDDTKDDLDLKRPGFSADTDTR